ncbi:MAG: energy-coupling factor ABC transporter permease [Brevinematales bacterium]|nr:energy-coupling factor ABC transporter permease [Brevinematales bacterium]
MHIPEYLLKGAICPVSAAVGIAGVAIATYFVYKSQHKVDILKFGILTSLVFLLQMLNFPVSHGTSGHFLGTALLIFMLGIPDGILAMSIILTIQAFVFADGGITVLGANIFNMAIFGAIPAVIFYKHKKNKFTMFFASILSVIFAAFSCSTLLAISYPQNLTNIFFSMMSIHFLIAIFEGIITTIAFVFLNLIFENISFAPLKYLSIFGIIIAFILITPFASNLPDGLEWVVQKYNLLKESEPLFVALIPEYSFNNINNEILSTILAGISGIIITLFISMFMLIILNFKKSKKILLKNQKGA